MRSLRAVARAKVPEADFHVGRLDDLPVLDASVDLVLCALAPSHVPDLGAVLAEFARVVRPGGHVVIDDVSHDLVFRGSVAKALGPNGEPGLVPAYRHTPGDYLRAALPVGLQVRRCDEPGCPRPTRARRHRRRPTRSNSARGKARRGRCSR